jgi:putative transposase
LKFVLAHNKDQSMKRSRFSEEQIIGILKEHEAGVSVADLCRKHGVSDASIYKWKAKFGGMDVSEAKYYRLHRSGSARHTRRRPDRSLPLRPHLRDASDAGPATQLEKLRTDAAECEMIRDLATEAGAI